MSANVYYEKKVKDLCDTKPHNWWRDVKQLCGTAMQTGNDLKTCLHPDLICDKKTLAQNINEVFINTMKDYSSLTDSVQVPIHDDKPISVTEQAVLKKLLAVNISRAGGPDDLSNWVLREFAEILAEPVTDILNTSFSENKVPRVWKLADIAPLPKASTISYYNKDLRPISLTSTLSKIAEGFVIEKSVKPVMLPALDPCQ